MRLAYLSQYHLPMTMTQTVSRARRFYPVVLSYTAVHSGSCSPSMAGHTHDEELGFCSRQDAENFVARINSPKISRRNGWSITAYTVETVAK